MNINKDGEEVEKKEPKKTGFKCNKCGEGNIVEKTSRRGKIFYACDRFPKCKNAMWDPPVDKPCPECGCPITTEKETKRAGLIRKCPACDWQDPPAKKKAEAKETKGAKKPAKKATKSKTTKKSSGTKKKATAKKAKKSA